MFGMITPPPFSKPLNHSDQSGWEFASEMLAGDPTYAINFDRLQKHPHDGYIIFEYLLCHESQTVTPFTSHPKRYWSQNKHKFLALWDATQHLKATLYLVNYAHLHTPHENEVLLIHVLDMNEAGIQKETLTRFTRQTFQRFFRQLNKEYR